MHKNRAVIPALRLEKPGEKPFEVVKELLKTSAERKTIADSLARKQIPCQGNRITLNRLKGSQKRKYNFLSI